MKLTEEEKRSVWVKFACALLSNPTIADGKIFNVEGIVDVCCDLADEMVKNFEATFVYDDE